MAQRHVCCTPCNLQAVDTTLHSSPISQTGYSQCPAFPEGSYETSSCGCAWGEGRGREGGRGRGRAYKPSLNCVWCVCTSVSMCVRMCVHVCVFIHFPLHQFPLFTTEPYARGLALIIYGRRSSTYIQSLLLLPHCTLTMAHFSQHHLHTHAHTPQRELSEVLNLLRKGGQVVLMQFKALQLGHPTQPQWQKDRRRRRRETTTITLVK